MRYQGKTGMDKIYVVRVLDWRGNYVGYSLHRTLEGADKAAKEAGIMFCTSSYWVETVDVKE